MIGIFIVDGEGHRIAGAYVEQPPPGPLKIEQHIIPSWPPVTPEPGVIPDHIVLSEN